MSTGQRKTTKALVGVVSAMGALAAGATITANADSIQVKQGDTVWELSQKLGVSIQDLEQQNSIDSKTDMIFVGQKLQVRSAKTQQTHTVKSGDTLWDLAQQYHVSVAQLQKANHMDGDVLSVGQNLTIPKGSVAATTSTTNSTATTTRSATQQTTQKASAVQAQIVAQQQAAASKQQQKQSAAATSSSTTKQSVSTPAANSSSRTSSSTVKDNHVNANTTKAPVASRTSSQSTSSTTSSNSAVTSSNSATTPSTTSSSQPVQRQSRAATVSSQSVSSSTTTQSSTQATTPSKASTSAVTSSSSQTQAQPQTGSQNATATTRTKRIKTTTQSAVRKQAAKATTATSTNTTNTSSSATAATSSSTKKTTNTAGLTSGSVTGLALKLASANIPYVWGGSSLSGMDCSGLVAYVYKNAMGVSLPHNTVSQEAYVSTHSVASAKPGDILFWGTKGSTYHDAIYLGNNQFVAAPQPGQNVKVQQISSYFMPSFAGTLK